MKKLVLAALCALVGGCSAFIPDGNPPEGNIVSNKSAKPMKRSEVAEYLKTELGLFLAANYERPRICYNLDPNADIEISNIIVEACIVGGARKVDQSDIRIVAKVTGDVWDFSVVDKGETVWQEIIGVR